MRLGFDLDKVFIDYPPFVPDSLIDRLYKKKTTKDLVYRMPNIPEQYIRQISHLPLFRPPLKENLTFLKKAANKNEVFLISSRFHFLEKQTTKLAKSLGFDLIFDGMYFNYTNIQPHLFKKSILKELKLDKYVDDDLSLLLFVAKHIKTTKFYWLTHKKSMTDLPSNITQINSIKEMLSSK